LGADNFAPTIERRQESPRQMRADNSAQVIPTIARNVDKRVYEVYTKMKITLLKWELDRLSGNWTD